MISLVKSWNGSLEALMISIFEVSNEASMKQAKAFWIEQYIPSKEDTYMLISHFLSELIDESFMSHDRLSG